MSSIPEKRTDLTSIISLWNVVRDGGMAKCTDPYVCSDFFARLLHLEIEIPAWCKCT
jgi:hypothetical protein